MKKNTFIERHPSLTSVMAVVIWFAIILTMTLFCGCKSQVVTIVTTDTLHVYHTDTIHSVHADTIYKIETKVVHDSIIRETIIKVVVNEAGEVIHSEKETNNESWHNSVGYSQLIQHTVDSLLKVKMDSIYHAKEKPVVVEVEKPTHWYTTAWNWIVDRFAWIGLAVVIGFLIYIFIKLVIPKLLKR